ncbi:MAG TPA: epoxide hydrolase N-terminal domain-containing protein, partial [Acidimicrobiia bacterium]|nr:epoxide hydrolase N-terminal domain-containing protein [Acidimicrobiia bacterium]
MAVATPSTKIQPFRVEVPQADLDDLDERLARARLPQPPPTDDWEYG